MPDPKAIDVPNLGFSEEQITVLHIMMNKEEKDYSTVEEIARMDELSNYSSSSIRSILKMTGLVPSEQQAIMVFSSFIQPLMMEPP